MVGDSWTHKLARLCILPLVRTSVTPNHLTGVRLLTGIIACGLFATGSRELEIWGGWMWLLSAFLDRADGRIAARLQVDSDGLAAAPVAVDELLLIYGRGGTLSALRVQ